MSVLLRGIDENMAHAAAQLDAVIERVFHQRLQGQLWQHTAAQFRPDADLIAQDIPVAHLLDLQIATHMNLFLAKRNNIAALAQRTAEEI